MRLIQPCALPLVLLAACGCGLVVGDPELPPAEAWCEQGSADVAEAEVTHVLHEGVWTTSAVTFFDAEGRALVEMDLAESSQVERRTAMAYDEEGRPTVTSVDDGADGTVDETTSWDYSVPKQTTVSRDTDADGQPDSIETTTYAEDDAILRRETDWDVDGTADMIEAYTYGEDGLPYEVRRDRPTEHSVAVYTYDEMGRAARIVDTTFASDGLIKTERVDELERNEAGLVTTQRTSWRVGLAAEYVERRTYDSQGRVIRTELLGPSGPPGFVVEFRYGSGTTPILTRLAGTGGGDGWDMVITRTTCD